MDIAVIADIHSNYIALEHCMAYCRERGINTFLFLGDYIGEMAYPERIMQLLYDYREKYDCHFIKGNKENYWLDYRKKGETGWLEYNSTTGALLYAYQLLTKQDLEFFESLPITENYTFEDLPTLTVCHGSPRNVREQMILDENLTKEILESSQTDYILCGHTHIQGKLCYQGDNCSDAEAGASSATDMAVTLTGATKVVLNPGSVGLPLFAESSCQFMILHGENHRWTEEFINLSYDTEAVIEQLTESGLWERAPYWCMITAHLLRNNGNSSYGHAEVLQRAMELCRQETGTCNWPHIPEKYWEAAMKDFLPNL